MAYRGFRTWVVPLLGAVALLMGACSGDAASSGKGALQSSCVSNQLNLDRTDADGSACDNWGYSDCYGFASECIGYCAFGFCQPESCSSAENCVQFFREIPLGVGWECNEYVVSSTSYGTWCEIVKTCPEGTLNCPCAPGEMCGSDPFGSGDMACANGTCESSCPSACIQGSVCCGGSLCGGDCIGTPCC